MYRHAFDPAVSLDYHEMGRIFAYMRSSHNMGFHKLPKWPPQSSLPKHVKITQ